MSKESFEAWLSDEDTGSKSRNIKSNYGNEIKVGELVRETIPIMIR